MQNPTNSKWLASLALVLALAYQARASFPEPDLLIHGFRGTLLPTSIVARWGNGESSAISLPRGYYLLRVPIDSSTTDAVGGRPFAAHFGDVVEIVIAGQVIQPLTITGRGMIVSLDLVVPIESQFRRGDTSGDGNVNLTDAVQTLNYLFQGGAGPSCPDAADADDNGQLQITDAVSLLGYLFLGTQALPAPGTQVCGVDPVGDDLDYCLYEACGSGGGGGGGAAVERLGLAKAPHADVLGAQAREQFRLRMVKGGQHGRDDGAMRPIALGLEVYPQANLGVIFGDVAVGETSIKTVLLWNPTASTMILEPLAIEGEGLQVLDRVCELPPLSGRRIPVLFAPHHMGEVNGLLSLGRHATLAVAGSGVMGSAICHVGDILVAPRAPVEIVEIAVPVTLPATGAVGELFWSLDQLSEAVTVVGLSAQRSGDLSLPDSLDRGHASGHMPITGQKLDCDLLVRLNTRRAVLAHVLPLVLTIEQGTPASARILPVSAGEIVVAQPELDLDGDGSTTPTKDLVYALRAIQGLEPVPPRAGEQVPQAEILTRSDLVAALKPEPFGATNMPEALQLVRRLAFGLETQQSPDAKRYSEFLSRSAYDQTQKPAPDDIDGRAIWMDCGEENRRPSPALAMASFLQPPTAVVVDLELDGDATPFIESSVAPSISGRAAGRPSIHRVVFHDPLGETVIPAGHHYPLATISAVGGKSQSSGIATCRLLGVQAVVGAVWLPVTSLASECQVPIVGGIDLASPKHDCDHNGVFEARDIVAIARLVFGAAPAPANVVDCDVNKDGILEMEDIVRLARELIAAGR